MSLLEFFEKQAKKNTKKKKHPKGLLEQMVDIEKQKDASETSVTLDSSAKPPHNENEDEWENMDDEKEVDVQNIRINTFNTVMSDESSRQLPKSKDDQDGDETVDEKKVWANKPVQVPVEKPPEPATPSEPLHYVPVHLRKTVAVAAKPNMSSSADFPTLDVAAVTEVPKKAAPATNDHSWQQAVAKRPNREAVDVPNNVDPPVSVYVPPGLRQSNGTTPTYPSVNQSQRGPSSRDETGWRRNFGYGALKDNDYSKGPDSDTTVGWSRGHKISDPSNEHFTMQIPAQRSNQSKPLDNGWSRNVTMKTYKETPREKASLNIFDTNRFAGLSKT